MADVAFVASAVEIPHSVAAFCATPSSSPASPVLSASTTPSSSSTSTSSMPSSPLRMFEAERQTEAMVSSVARTSSPRPWGCGFYVPYEVRDAGSGKGNGVFAKEPIAAGTLIWHGDDDVCRWYSESEFRALLPTLSSDEIRYKLNHAYAMSEVNHEKIIELPRDAGSVNHSSQPNSVTPYVYEAQTGRRVDPSQWPLPAGQRVYLYNACVALRDIAAGEELVENYHEFHNPAWYVHLCREYGVESAEAVAHTYG